VRQFGITARDAKERSRGRFDSLPALCNHKFYDDPSQTALLTEKDKIGFSAVSAE